MSQSGSDSKHTAPLISLRRSFRLKPTGIVLLGVGMWLVLAVFGLYEHVQLLAGSSTGWAYLLAGLLLIPSILTFFELRGWIGNSGGSYRLIRSLEHNTLTFFAGWVYVIGWASISALLAQTFASHASRLVAALTPVRIHEIWLIAALLLLFVVTNVTNIRPSWRVSIWLAGFAILFLALIAGSLTLDVLEEPGRVLRSSGSGGQNFFGTVVILFAGMWVIELMADTGDRRRRFLGTDLILLLGGPLLAALMALTARWSAAGAGTIEGLASAVFPEYGRVAALLVATLVSGVTWQVLGLLMLRRFQVIGLDGWLPAPLLSAHTRFKTPILLILVQVVLTVGMLALGPAITRLTGARVTVSLNLAAVAALAYLLLATAMNIAGIVLNRRARAEDRPFRLPLYPAIPATGAAISALLLLAVPWPVLTLGVIWLALGALVYWRIGRERMRESRLGVTVFQDTPSESEPHTPYPVLVPVANPNTALGLVKFGAAIARAHGGHVIVLQVIQVPEQLPLDSARVQARERQSLLERVLDEMGRSDVPLEGITRLSRSVSQGILETVAEEAPKTIVMGWHARDRGERRGRLGNILDSVLENAASNVVVVRGDWHEVTRHVLVPVAGGPHAPVAAELALDLTRDTDGRVTLLNIAQENGTAIDEGMALATSIRAKLSEPERVEARVALADSPLDGILNAMDEHDAVLMGASELDFLDREFFGQLSFQIAQQTTKAVALVRSYTGLRELVARRAWSSISDVLPQLDAQEQVETYREMRDSAQPNVNFFILIATSAVIATLGLLLNSAAVIIGAMLVAPLMTPFISMSVAIVMGNIRMMQDALAAIVQGALLGIFIALISTLISPLAEPTPELLSRTQPNLIDLMIALAAGVAGSYAIARKEVGAALPGVAIAAALMPPLCTVGVGIAIGSLTMAVGAFLLFVTNLVAIVFAAAIVFLLLGMRPPERPERQRWLRRGLSLTLVSLALVSIPLGLVLARTVQRGQIESETQSVFRQHLAEWDADAELGSLDIELGWRQVDISGTVYVEDEVTSEQINALDAALERELGRDVQMHLFVLRGQMFQSGES